MGWTEAIECDGFAIVPDVVAPEVLDALISALDAKGPGPAILERGGSAYAMRDLLREVPEARRLAESEPLLELVRRSSGRGRSWSGGSCSTRRPRRTGQSPGTRT